MDGISSVDQFENWDSDEDEDDDGGPRPSELYGKHTWEIDKYSQITKGELQSNAFEAGGYKWFIEVCPENPHLSFLLSLANVDKLLPGWSHLVHFTIVVLNPKKSRYIVALQHFWKKGYKWEFSKFVEVSEVEDDGTLIIEAHVQVIREREDRPFPCLDPQYRGILVHFYRTKVEQIFCNFVEERLAKLRNLTEDISRWSSFCAFWSDADPASRHRMSRVEMDSTLKVIVKHFLIDGEVAVYVMDSIYNGLKALKGQHKGKKSKAKAVDSHIAEEDLSVHFICIEKDSFILGEVDDALQLLERAASEPFPPKSITTDNGATAEESYKDATERYGRQLAKLGRQAIEIFVLEQIFSKIEAAYEEEGKKVSEKAGS